MKLRILHTSSTQSIVILGKYLEQNLVYILYIVFVLRLASKMRRKRVDSAEKGLGSQGSINGGTYPELAHTVGPPSGHGEVESYKSGRF